MINSFSVAIINGINELLEVFPGFILAKLPMVSLQIFDVISYCRLQQQLSLLSQANWGRLEMKPTENKNKNTKNTKRAQAKGRVRG
jgi:hypothetical protein